jgi:hypothetical protein
MAAITAISASNLNDFIDAPETTLTASDTITFNSAKVQILLVTNTTAGALTLLIDGDGGTTVNVAGIGAINVAAGKTIIVPATTGSKLITLSTISAYCQGVVTLTGAVGAKVRLIELG